MNTQKDLVIKADFLHFLSEEEMVFIPNGMLWISKGKIKKLGKEADIKSLINQSIEVKDYSGKLVMPGFIDGHVHAVQTQAIASYGKRLLDWLETYIFPLEQKFSDPDFARPAIRFFLQQLLKNGTTSAAIFPSRHPEATALLFEEALALNMRILAGKTSMDRNAPKALCDDTQLTFAENAQLIKKYHNKGRLRFMLTPRFAITSTEEQFEALNRLKKENPDLGIQTHLSENKAEVESTKALFPKSKGYLDVYDQYELLGKGSLMAHAIYLEDEEWARLAKTQTSIIHCPSSNLFLGSGLFNLQKCRDYHIPFALGSDVGGGISFSMFKTAAEAYKVAAVQNIPFTAQNAFYSLTLGGAKALNINDSVGNFEEGKEADFIVIEPKATELMTERLKGVQDLNELLFVLLILGDERNIEDVYLEGKKQEFHTN